MLAAAIETLTDAVMSMAAAQASNLSEVFFLIFRNTLYFPSDQSSRDAPE